MAVQEAKTSAQKTNDASIVAAIEASLAEKYGCSIEKVREHLASLREDRPKDSSIPSIEDFLADEPETVFYYIVLGRNDFNQTGVPIYRAFGSQVKRYSDKNGTRELTRDVVELNIQRIQDPRSFLWPEFGFYRFDVAESKNISVTPECVKRFPHAKLRRAHLGEAYTLTEAMDMLLGAERDGVYVQPRAWFKTERDTGELFSAEEVREKVRDRIEDWRRDMARWKANGAGRKKPKIKPYTLEDMGYNALSGERPPIGHGRVTMMHGNEKHDLNAIPAMS